MNLSSIQMALLDSVFDELEAEAEIRISFSVCFDRDAGTGNREFIVHSVNSCESTEQYRRKLEKITASLLERVHQQSVKMEKEACTLFMVAARERLQCLRNTLRFDRCSGVLHGKRPCWVFHNPLLDCESTLAIPAYVRNAVLRLSSPYAFAWKTALSACDERLKDMVFYFTVIGNQRPATAAEVPHFNKLLVKTPVPDLACFIFAASDAGLIQADTKQELYRICCGMFRTSNAPEISPKSFRNHFDYPTPEALQETRNNLHLMIAAINHRLSAILGALFLVLRLCLSGF
jgi:hypothetical protein